jgi:N-acetylneuraminic acid mutarotase
MVIFGGQSDKYCNDTHFLEFKTSSWRPINVGGAIPCGRYYHSAVIYGDTMIVFGGEKRLDTYLNDLYILNLTNYSWSKIDSKQVPGKRYNHSCCIYDSKMFIFGGYGGEVRYNDLWQFDITSKAWKLVDCCGEIPGEMSGHSATVIGDEMFIFGGGRNHVYYSTLYRYNFHRREFQIVESRGDIPEPRGYHKMVEYNGELYLFGGDSKLKYFDDMFRLSIYNNIVARNLMCKLKGQIFHDLLFE